MIKPRWRQMLAVLVPVLFSSGCGGGAAYRSLNSTEIAELIKVDTGVVLLDVRSPAEYAGETGHLAGAIHIPVGELEQRIGELENFKSQTIVAYCRAGRRSARAAEILAGKGYSAVNLLGGITAWREGGFPVVRDSVTGGRESIR